MFKRKYVKISSEKVTQKIEGFLCVEGWSETLSPIELYAFRYGLNDMKIDINNPFIIERIGLNDIPSIFKSSKFIIFSENDKYGVKSDDDILEICSNLDKRMIFVIFSEDNKYIEQICIYLPYTEDTSLFIKGIYDIANDVCVADSEEIFIRDLSSRNKDLIKYHFQDNAIVSIDNLNFEKEFFSFTKLDINGSTITFHYVP